MAQGGLRKWVKEKWVDIGAPKEERKISTVRKIEGEQKSISKVRPTCKSHTDDKLAKGECCQKKAPSPEHWP
jgi:hypothetical protein